MNEDQPEQETLASLVELGFAHCFGVPATILGAIAGATLIKSQPEWATAFTLLASLLTGLMTFLKPNERAAMHRAAAGQFLALRNDARFFREVELLQSERLIELPERLKVLSAMRNELNLKSIPTPRAGQALAKKPECGTR